MCFTESWEFDKTGNWLQFNKNGTIENRTHNASNEIQGIATHDKNGNMTVMPGQKGTYDAWNRLVEVRDTSDHLIARYDYNGLNQRIKKTAGSVVTTSFFNEDWQELESVTNNQLTAYVWGKRYVDDLVLRDNGSERLYSLADPNWNVVATTDASGVVQERMKYDAFGKVTWLDASFATKANSNYVWNRTFTGQVLDAETGLMLYRGRYYHTGLGRFINRDPIEYLAGDTNLYRYVGKKAPLFVKNRRIWSDTTKRLREMELLEAPKSKYRNERYTRCECLQTEDGTIGGNPLVLFGCRCLCGGVGIASCLISHRLPK